MVRVLCGLKGFAKACCAELSKVNCVGGEGLLVNFSFTADLADPEQPFNP